MESGSILPCLENACSRVKSWVTRYATLAPHGGGPVPGSDRARDSCLLSGIIGVYFRLSPLRCPKPKKCLADGRRIGQSSGLQPGISPRDESCPFVRPDLLLAPPPHDASRFPPAGPLVSGRCPAVDLKLVPFLG